VGEDEPWRRSVLRLDVYDGSHRRTLTVDADIVRVGRGPECEVVLAGDTTVSRVHATLTHNPDGWTVSDNASRNGTFVNGRRLDSERPLAPADRVLIGNFILVPQSAGDGEVETALATGGQARAQLETGLSDRELEVLRLLCAGDSDQQIADALFISVKTVQSHLDRIRTKSGARRRVELIRFAMDHGIA
jgi:DNA-binding CsgD family transcriptional regulator